jgi:hypothetical protein
MSASAKAVDDEPKRTRLPGREEKQSNPIPPKVQFIMDIVKNLAAQTIGKMELLEGNDQRGWAR